MEKNQLDHLQPPRISSVAFTSVRSYDCDPTPACGRPKSFARTCFRRIKDDTYNASNPPLPSSARPGDFFVSARNSRSADDVMRGPSSDHSSSAKKKRMRWKEAQPRTTSDFLSWSEPKQSWSCSACTFVNENVLHLSCSVCGTQREKRFSETDLHLQNKPALVDYRAEECPSRQSTDRNCSLTKSQEIEEEWVVTLKAERAHELIKLQEELLDGYNSSRTSLVEL